MNEKRREELIVFFDFKCPACGAEGELGIDSTEGMHPFGCPENCGSTFIPWQPNGQQFVLKCVVQAQCRGNRAAA
jgi:hypothetical protein